jgi:hypothetical protein
VPSAIRFSGVAASIFKIQSGEGGYGRKAE